MFFQPVVGAGGYSGWLVLQRTEPRQREIFEQSPSLQRNVDYFRENIQNAVTAKDLISDRRLLTVALGAFGLDDELNKQAFVQKILEEGTETDDTFANRLNEPKFIALADAFGYGNASAGANIIADGFSDDIISRYKARAFDLAVGEVDNDARLALNYRREIDGIVSEDSSQETIWFRIMGQQPIREVLETALNLPSEISQLDIDRQRELFEDKAAQVLGSSDPAILSDPDVMDDLLRRFFLIRQTENGPTSTTPGFSALSLLQAAPLGAGAAQNLFQSQF